MRSSHLLFVLGALALPPARARAQDTPPAPPAEPDDRDLVDFTGAPADTRPVTAPASGPPSVAPPPAAPTPPTMAAPAQPSVPSRAALRPYRKNAVNFSVLGFVIGNLRLTYERLLRPKHGLYAEGIVAPDLLNGLDFFGVGGAMGYRFHWRGPGTGGFVGAGVTLLRRSGRVSVYDFEDKDTYRYRGSLFSVGVGPQVGKRWLWERTGINLTIRFGAGLVLSKTYPKQSTPKKASDGLTRFPIGAEGELSVGYTF